MSSSVKDLMKLKKKQSKNAEKAAKKGAETGVKGKGGDQWGVPEGKERFNGWNMENKK